MSSIGKAPVVLPAGVTAKVENNVVKVQGVEELDVPDKQITGIFFDSVPDDVEDEEKTKAEYPSFEYISLREDHDFVWFEEAHAIAQSF